MQNSLSTRPCPVAPRLMTIFAALFLFAGSGARMLAASQVWVADFDTTAGSDGMVEFQNGNPAKAMFNPLGASGGALQVTLEDGITYNGLHDKGGRLLGTTVDPFTTSFSGYYRFVWSQLPESASQV